MNNTEKLVREIANVVILRKKARNEMDVVAAIEMGAAIESAYSAIRSGNEAKVASALSRFLEFTK